MTARRKRLRLFVWRDVLCDYSCGGVAVLAATVEAAETEIEKEIGYRLGVAPEEWDPFGEPKTLIVYGGG